MSSEAFDRRVLRNVRSVMETPLLDERKWAKLPGIAADAFIIDLEDSVVPALKEEARKRAVEVLADPDFFGGRLVLARPNNLATPWGRDDIEALTGAGVELMLYPKAQGAAEVAEAVEINRSAGGSALVLPIIETAGALLDLLAISRLPHLGGLFTGVGDLSADFDVPFRLDDGALNPFLDRARDQVALAAAAAGVLSADTLFTKDIRDADEVRTVVSDIRRRGFTTVAAFYPPHIEVINDMMSVSAEEIADAHFVVETYLTAQRDGRPAVVLDDGRTLLAIDLARAHTVLARAEQSVPTTEVFA